MAELWRAVFRLRMDEAERLYAWLDEKWLPTNPCTFRLGHGGRIIIEGKARDDVYKVSEWVRNQNPLGTELNYSVIGYDGLRVSYLSYCPKCRSGVSRHYEHSEEKVP